MRQWKDLVTQLREMCQEFKFKVGEPIPASRPDLGIRQLPINQQAAHSLCCSWDAQGIHTSMLSGLLSMMGMQIVREPKASDFAGLKGAATRSCHEACAEDGEERLSGRARHAFRPVPGLGRSQIAPRNG